MILTLLFWICLFFIFYTYVGYPILLWILVKANKKFGGGRVRLQNGEAEPDVCLFVTAYNESDYVDQKVANSFALDYPKEKIQYVWVTDGSNDDTPQKLRKYKELEVYHLDERRGKMHAMNRGVGFVKAPIIIFSDTNTLLGKNSIREIVNEFRDPLTGCVAGEKRIIEDAEEAAATAGEGLYWKYESWLKRNDSELNSAVGAVGELFAVRTELFEEVETDTILDDFIISLRIALKGYRIAYAPNAYAEEKASLNVAEELKRKIRIAAGGVQTLFRLKALLNPVRCGLLSWQYISHKVLRWTFTPIALFLLSPLNLLIVVNSKGIMNPEVYITFLYLQVLAYLLAAIGWFFENRKLRFKILFVPYYFVSIHYAAIRGMLRYFKGQQSVKWEKSKRA